MASDATTGATVHHRLLIGADCYADAVPAIRLAEILFGQVVRELGGILVEEEAIADLPAHACTVITTAGMLTRGPAPQQLQRIRNSDARSFLARLEALAGACRFERRHGDLIATLSEAARDWDWLAIGHRRIGRGAGNVIAISPAGTAGPVAEVAALLARRMSSRLLHVDPTRPRQELIARISRLRAEVVVVDAATGPFREPGSLRVLVEAARCPVLIHHAFRLRSGPEAPAAAGRAAERGG